MVHPSFWSLKFGVHPTFCSLTFRMHSSFWSLKFRVHPGFCSFTLRMHPVFSECTLDIQGASSIEHTMNIYSDTRGVHVHPVHPGWIRPWIKKSIHFCRGLVYGTEITYWSNRAYTSDEGWCMVQWPVTDQTEHTLLTRVTVWYRGLLLIKHSIHFWQGFVYGIGNT